MKTKTNYTEKAKTAKAILVAGFILIAASLTASDNSEVNRNLENAKHYLNDDAYEAEYKIEDWMCTIYTDFLNAVANEEAIEPEIELEDWMYNIHNIFWLDLNDAEEPEMTIENWMTNPESWIYSGNEYLLTFK